MSKPRILVASLSIALAGLLVAIVVVLIHGNGNRPQSTLVGNTNTSTGSGPYLTASAIPTGLAARRVPQFRLDDARQGAFSSTSLAGRPYVVTFLYVHCIDVCPLIGSEIHDALHKLGPQAKRLPVIAISVDPRGDTRDAVRRWLSQHQEPSNFHYLIGDSRQLEPIWRSFYVSPQTPGDPTSSHTAVIWLIDRHRHPAALISAGIPINTTNLAHDFRVLLSSR